MITQSYKAKKRTAW